jgi:hypothetical protein
MIFIKNLQKISFRVLLVNKIKLYFSKIFLTEIFFKFSEKAFEIIIKIKN